MTRANKRKSKRAGKGQRRGISDQTDKIVTISGHQVYSTVQGGTSGTKLFNTTNTVGISPDFMGTNIAALADRYNKYFFKALTFEYVPNIYNLIDSSIASPLTDNQFSFGYVQDGQSTFTVNYGSITECQHMMIVPPAGFRNRRDNMLRVRIPRGANPWMWNLNDSTTTASLRQTVQGLLLGEALNAFTTSFVFGTILIHYTICFTEMVPDQGFTLRSLMREAELGSTVLKDRLEKCLFHARVYGREHVIPPEEEDQYSNEELTLLTGKGRPPDRPVQVRGLALVIKDPPVATFDETGEEDQSVPAQPLIDNLFSKLSLMAQKQFARSLQSRVDFETIRQKGSTDSFEVL